MVTRQQVQQLHRIIGVVVFIPVCLWALSGILHPLMSSIKPKAATHFIQQPVIDSSDIKVDLYKCFNQIGLSTIHNVKFIKLNHDVYYQVFITPDSITYLNAQTGQFAPKVEKLYATQLARIFLGDEQSQVTSITKQTQFDDVYKEINRLLPVWKVEFDNNRSVYVETSSSRLGTINDTLRKNFLWFFGVFHSWNFIPGPKWIQVLVLGLVSGVSFLTAVSGIWIYLINSKTYRKIKAKTHHLKKRKTHRKVGLIFSVFTLMFSFSGGYHAISKLNKNKEDVTSISNSFNLNTFKNVHNIFGLSRKPILNFSIVKISGQNYFRILAKDGKKPTPHYVNTSTGELLEKGELVYAKELANQFSGNLAVMIDEVAPIYKFNHEYGFINKRLPVIKVSYNTSGNPDFYVETSTGILAATITNAKRLEGFSFGFLHKFHFLDFLGKTTRNCIAVLAALSLVVISITGIRLIILKK